MAITIAALSLGLVVALTSKPPEPLDLRIRANNGRFYPFNMPKKMHAELPTWDLKQHDHPPMSFKKAIDIANGLLPQITAATAIERIQWQLDSISISTFDQTIDSESKKWCYLAYYRGHRMSGRRKGYEYSFRMIIFMDGTIVFGWNIDLPWMKALKQKYPWPDTKTTEIAG